MPDTPIQKEAGLKPGWLAWITLCILAAGSITGTFAALAYYGGPHYPLNLVLAIGLPLVVCSAVSFSFLADLKVIQPRTCAVLMFIPFVGFAALLLTLNIHTYILPIVIGMALGMLTITLISATVVAFLKIMVRYYKQRRNG